MFTKTTVLLVLTALLLVLTGSSNGLRVNLNLNEQVNVNAALNQYLLPINLSANIDNSLTLTLSRSSNLLGVANIFVGINDVPDHNSNADFSSICSSLNVLGLQVGVCAITIPNYVLNGLLQQGTTSVSLYIDIVTSLNVDLKRSLSLNTGFQLVVSAVDIELNADVTTLTNLRIGDGADLYAVINVPTGSVLSSVTLTRQSGSLLGGSLSNIVNSGLKIRAAADVNTFADVNANLDLSLAGGNSQSVFTLNIPIDIQLGSGSIDIDVSASVATSASLGVSASVDASASASGSGSGSGIQLRDPSTSADVSASIGSIDILGSGSLLGLDLSTRVYLAVFLDPLASAVVDLSITFTAAVDVSASVATSGSIGASAGASVGASGSGSGLN